MELQRVLRGFARRGRRWAVAALAVHTEWRRRRGLSNTKRWRGEVDLHQAWDARTSRLAALIPGDSSVLEFGAGRMTLREHLSPGSRYIPSDLVPRGDGTLVLDLNRHPLPELPEAEVAVFGGVLEYVFDVPSLLSHLHSTCRYIVASYAPFAEGGPREIVSRRGKGWVNDYTEDDLLALFLRSGFFPEHEEAWYEQRLYRFRKQHMHPVMLRK